MLDATASPLPTTIPTRVPVSSPTPGAPRLRMTWTSVRHSDGHAKLVASWAPYAA